MTIDETGFANLAGVTYSPNFPTTPGAYKETGANFVARFDMLPTGVSAYGSSSPGCDGALAIGVTSWPQAGNAAFSVNCNNAPPGTSGILVLGGAPPATPVSVLGASLWVDVVAGPFAILPATSNARGGADVLLPIPAAATLPGKTLYAQLFWQGPTGPAPCPPQGISASNALAVTIQP